MIKLRYQHAVIEREIELTLDLMLSPIATLMLIKLMGSVRGQRRSSAIYTHLFVQKELREERTISVSHLVHDSLTRTARVLRIN